MPPPLYWATQFLTERSEQLRAWAIWLAVHLCLARMTAWTRFQERHLRDGIGQDLESVEAVMIGDEHG